MKANRALRTLAVAGGLTLLALHANADGTVLCNNYDSGYGIWIVQNGVTNPAPAGTMVQVLGGPDADHLSAVTNTLGVDGYTITSGDLNAMGSGTGSFFDYSFGPVAGVTASNNAVLQVVAWYGSYIGGSAVWTQATGSDPAPSGSPPPTPTPTVLNLPGRIYMFYSGMAPIHGGVTGAAPTPVAPAPLGPGPLGPYPSGSLWLSITNNRNGTVTPTLHGTEPGYPYTLLTNTDLNSPVWTPRQVLADTSGSGQIGFDAVSTTDTAKTFFRTAIGFQGINGGDQSAYDIADTDGAVGPSNFVEIVNFKIAVYDKAGNRLTNMPTVSFFAVPGTGYPSNSPLDARVIYDQQSGRWLACGVDSLSQQIVFAYTTNSSPLPLTDGWTKKVLMLAKAGDDCDSPTLGVDTGGVYVSVLRFFRTNGVAVIDDNVIACMPKPGVYQGSNTMTVLTNTTQTANGDLPTWKVQVAVNLDSAPLGGWAWCIAKGLPQGTGTYYWPGTNYYRRIQWTGTSAS